MDIEKLKRDLEYVKEKHKDDNVKTGETDVSLMAYDCLSAIHQLEKEALSESNTENVVAKESTLRERISNNVSSVEQRISILNELDDYDSNIQNHIKELEQTIINQGNLIRGYREVIKDLMNIKENLDA